MNYSEQNLNHAHKVLTSMMKSIHDVCVRNNIQYWLDYGSLIGAVRHKGFIPWDDDLDICMFREDYDHFDKIAQEELGDDFFWQTYKTDKNWTAHQGKIRLKRTLWLESCFADSNLKENGFFIDVFPLDNTYNNILFRKVHFFLARLFVVSGLMRLHKQKRKDLKGLICKMIPRNVSMLVGDFVIKFKKKKSEYVTLFPLGAPEKFITMSSFFCETQLHEFEEEEFYIPTGYDKRLKMYYGDYMVPPPPEKRQGHHGIVTIDFGNY